LTLLQCALNVLINVTRSCKNSNASWFKPGASIMSKDETRWDTKQVYLAGLSMRAMTSWIYCTALLGDLWSRPLRSLSTLPRTDTADIITRWIRQLKWVDEYYYGQLASCYHSHCLARSIMIQAIAERVITAGQQGGKAPI
jgi:hypothetical protein